MKGPTLLVVALFCGLMPSMSASAQDLTTVERRIARQPAYAATPRFCRLVFGHELRTRVWLALDGRVLYVDRNANGDLTDDGPPVSAKSDGGADGDLLFELGEIRDGTLTHTNLGVSVRRLEPWVERDEQVRAYLAADPQARGYTVKAEIESPGWKGVGVGGRLEQLVFATDVHGFLKFADRPEDAPIVHFGGPWQITLYGRHRLTVGRSTEFVLGIGTPGLGPGTTAYVGYAGVVPENVRPTVEIADPPVRPEDAPVKEVHELPGRC